MMTSNSQTTAPAHSKVAPHTLIGILDAINIFIFQYSRSFIFWSDDDGIDIGLDEQEVVVSRCVIYEIKFAVRNANKTLYYGFENKKYDNN